MASAGNLRQSFTVPAGAGSYAPEELDLSNPLLTRGRAQSLADLSLLIELLPASCAIELDLLKPGAVRNAAGLFVEDDWILAGADAKRIWLTLGLQDMLPVAAWFGGRYRAKSGGTEGTAIISIGWDGP